jgi:hypothetical protein
MSIQSISPFLKLPVELLYVIFDQLDIEDIVLSFRYVCRQFYAMTNTYNRYTMKITNASRITDINFICQIIPVENFISLIIRTTRDMSTPFKLFLSSINIDHFTQLRSLRIYCNKEWNLDNVLSSIPSIPTLTSLSLILKNNNSLNDETIARLSSIIGPSSFRHIILCVDISTMNKIQWSNSCQLHRLFIRECSYQQFCSILYHSLNLQTFSLSDCFINETVPTVVSKPNFQLASLTLRNASMSIDQLELLLSQTPSLVHLDLKINRQVSFNFIRRFSQWETFLRQKLRLLAKFKFFIGICEYQFKAIESILTAFRTPFWLEDKRWFITCQLIANNDSNAGLILYTSEETLNEFPFNVRESILSYFTFTTRDDNASNMSSKWYARSNLTRMVEVICSNKVYEIIAIE